MSQDLQSWIEVRKPVGFHTAFFLLFLYKLKINISFVSYKSLTDQMGSLL